MLWPEGCLRLDQLGAPTMAGAIAMTIVTITTRARTKKTMRLVRTLIPFDALDAPGFALVFWAWRPFRDLVCFPIVALPDVRGHSRPGAR